MVVWLRSGHSSASAATHGGGSISCLPATLSCACLIATMRKYSPTAPGRVAVTTALQMAEWLQGQHSRSRSSHGRWPRFQACPPSSAAPACWTGGTSWPRMQAAAWSSGTLHMAPSPRAMARSVAAYPRSWSCSQEGSTLRHCTGQTLGKLWPGLLRHAPAPILLLLLTGQAPPCDMAHGRGWGSYGKVCCSIPTRMALLTGRSQPGSTFPAAFQWEWLRRTD